MNILIVCMGGAIPLFVNECGLHIIQPRRTWLLYLELGIPGEDFASDTSLHQMAKWSFSLGPCASRQYLNPHIDGHTPGTILAGSVRNKDLSMIGHCHAEFWKWNAEEMSCKKMRGPGRRPLRGMNLEPPEPEGDWCMVTVVFVEFVLVTIFTSAQAEIPSDNDQSRTLYTVNQAYMLAYLRPNTNNYKYTLLHRAFILQTISWKVDWNRCKLGLIEWAFRVPPPFFTKNGSKWICV